jgi:hypothetical protein
MMVEIKEFLAKFGVTEAFYPGKRIVKKLPQPGEYKSHCMVGDWRQPDLIHVEFKAGLSGKTLPARELKKYPISFQSPTYIEIAVRNDSNNARDGHEDEEDEEGSGERGKGGGGGQVMKKRSLNAFSEVVMGRIPDAGEIKKIVLMGKEIARGAFETVLESLAAQVRNMAVAPVNILASVTHVTRVAPGGRERTEVPTALLRGAKPYKPQDMFGAMPPPK